MGSGKPAVKRDLQKVLLKQGVERLIVDCNKDSHIPGSQHVRSETSEYAVGSEEIFNVPDNIAEEILEANLFKNSYAKIEQVGRTQVARIGYHH